MKVTFPPLFKSGKVLPLHKKNDESKPENFRQIPILSSLSKILEIAIAEQMTAFFERFNFFTSRQFDFRKDRNTSDANVFLQNFSQYAYEENRQSVTICLDLSRAFDCVNHQILSGKLEKYRFTGKIFNLISSYLNDRIQCAY